MRNQNARPRVLAGVSDVDDLVIIGGGTAGLVAAQVARRLGGRVTLIESDRPGGDCLWTGCVPSKSLIATATAAQAMRRADELGLESQEPKVDLRRILDRVRSVQAAIEPADSAEHLESLGIVVRRGWGRIDAADRVTVTDADGATSSLRTRKILIATGSRPVVPPIDGLDDAYTSDTIWTMDELPATLTVIGGGAIGCELGQAFARLGSEVTIVERADQLLPGFPKSAADVVEQSLRRDGVDVRLSTTLDLVDATTVLVATGRRARVDNLGLDILGVDIEPDGTIAVDDRLRTTIPGVYAAGDVVVGNGSTTLSVAHGRHVALHALTGTSTPPSADLVPKVVFTDPQVAMVGHTTETSVVYGHADHDRSLTAGSPLGFTELFSRRRGKLAGALIVGASAAESIAEPALALTLGAGVNDMSGPHAYPSFADATARAAEQHLSRQWTDTRRAAVARSWVRWRRRRSV